MFDLLIFDLLLMCFLGIGVGVFAGLLIGIHPNTISAFMLSISATLLSLFPIQAVVVFLVSMAISNVFLSIIPNIFIGMPDSDNVLSVLPGHRYLLEGRGYEAVYLSVIGGVGVIILSILLLPVLFFILPFTYLFVKGYIAWALVFVVLMMVMTEKGWKKLPALIVFILSGFLGWLSFSPPFSSQHILFPLLTGLFGISLLIIGGFSKNKIPPQVFHLPRLSRSAAGSGISKGFFSGLIVGILPGIGPSQAGVVVHQFSRKRKMNEFLIALGGISAVSTLFSLLSLYLIQKPRSGVAVAIERIAGGIDFNGFLLLVATSLFVTGISVIITLKLAKGFAGFIQKLDYNLLVKTILLFLIAMTFALTGPFGLLVLTTATAIGLLGPLLHIKRTHAMGCLILPIILWGIGFS